MAKGTKAWKYRKIWYKILVQDDIFSVPCTFFRQTIFPEKHPKNPKNQRYWRISHDICRFTYQPDPIGVVEAASSSLVTQTKQR